MANIPTDPGPAPAAAALRQSLADLVAESQALRSDVRAAEAARRRENRLSLGVLGLLALFIVLVLTVTWQTNVVSRQNQDIARNTAATNQRLTDCTVPGGKCYIEGTKRTGDAIGDLVRASMYVAECSRLHPGESGPAFDLKLEKCVADKLAAARQAPVPVPSPVPKPVS